MDLREQIARAIYAKRPDCERRPWPVNTDKERRAYPHNPIAAVDLSYVYADAALEIIAGQTAGSRGLGDTPSGAIPLPPASSLNAN